MGVSKQSVGLLISAAVLPSFILSPVFGVLADRIGRKRCIVPSLFFFGILGGICAFARDFETLLVLRLLHGITNAPLMSIPGAIIGDLYSGQKRADAMALKTTVMYVGYIIYPLIGGILAGFAWFYVYLPFLLGIPMGLITVIYLKIPEPKTRQPLKDYFRGTIYYLKSYKVLWLFLSSIITYILLYGAYLNYLSLYLGERFNASPFMIGMSVSIVGILTIMASSQVGRLNRRFSPVGLIITAFFVYALALFIIPSLNNLWICILPVTIFWDCSWG